MMHGPSLTSIVPPREDDGPYGLLDYADVKRRAEELAQIIEDRSDALTAVLLRYESYEVVMDETARSLDLLRSLDENRTFFQRRVGDMAVFLPRNQPLYAFCCFAVVPALMASHVHVRTPVVMRDFFANLLAVLDINTLFPTVITEDMSRSEFLRERTALRKNPVDGSTHPVTDAVIFTGTPAHATELRAAFDPRTLFIANGAGHNPLVVAADADIEQAVRAALLVQFYNQGQDCAAPNAVLVHAQVYEAFLSRLREGVRALAVGPYRDRACRIGPISDPADLVRIQRLFLDHRAWLDPTTPGIIRAADAIVEPTIVAKPLREGGNFAEVFAPVMFVQAYDADEDLARYFEHPSYAPHAMYVSLYGTSGYLDRLVGRRIHGNVLHDERSVLRDRCLHDPGVERGTQPYGGFGAGASSVSIGDRFEAKPTLPQRDIWEWLVCRRQSTEVRSPERRAPEVVTAPISTGQRQKPPGIVPASTHIYVDRKVIPEGDGRFVRVPRGSLHVLRTNPDHEAVAQLAPHERAFVSVLREGLAAGVHRVPAPDFRDWLYGIAGGPTSTDRVTLQKANFRAAYRLLFGVVSGPPLASFLQNVEIAEICRLLVD